MEKERGARQKMSHILRRLGEAALQFRQAGERRVLGPILGRRELKEIRAQWLAEGKGWPYEHIYPGACPCAPPLFLAAAWHPIFSPLLPDAAAGAHRRCGHRAA